MNRRSFLASTAGVVTFGFAARRPNAEGVKFGMDSPPSGFPELNFIDFPTPISDGVIPFRSEHWVGSHDGIYRIIGVHGPFTVTNDHRGCKCRLWAMHIDPDIARVTLERR